ncbi:MAG: hypothetical protein ACE5PO_07370 [Candidatus Bathyarchaeia archaeon]
MGNLDSNVGIATLWAPLELVAKHLAKDDYAVIGQLYSKTEGLNVLLRNCLANPNLRTIIVYGQDRASSGETLLKLKKHGVDKTHRILGTDVCVDAEISADAVEILRDNPLKSISHRLMGGIELDPRGNITITVSDGRVHLNRLDPEGVRIDEYVTGNVRNAQALLVENQKIGDLSHALYLGRELEKAHVVIKYNLEYEQDKPLPLKPATFK